MSHDVYILSTLCAISMYISFCEFVQTAHSTREKKFLLFSSLKMMTFFHELVRLITVIGIPFKAPFLTLYFVFAVEEFFFAVSFNNVKWSLVSFGLAFLVSSYNHLQHYILLYIHLNLIIVVS